MRSVYAYIRVSTVRQGEQGSSLQEQRDAIEAYARSHDLTISQWFEERETAAKQGRRAFARMIAALDKGKALGVIIHKIDRGARNLWDWASLQSLVDKGLEIHLAHESLDLSSRGGRLSADIQAVVAADYIRNLRDEVRKGIDGRLKQGLYPFRAPIGYRDMGKGQPKEPDPQSAPLVRRAFELYAAGAYSFDRLLPELHALGLRNVAGGPLSRNGLTTMFNNPFYVGLIRIRRRGQIHQGVHRPLVSKELFDGVKRVLSRNVHQKLRRHDFLFRRLVRCARCRHLLSGERQKGHVYYRCHSAQCPKTAVREEVVDDAIQTALGPVRFTNDELRELRLMVDDLRADWKSRAVKEIASANLMLEQIETRLTRLTDAYIDRLIDRDAFEARKQALLLDRNHYQELVARLGADGEAVVCRLNTFFELAQSALLSYRTGNAAGKRDVVNSTTSNLAVTGKNVVVELRNPFRAIAARQSVTDGDPQRDRVRTDGSRLKPLFDLIVSHANVEEPQDARGENLLH